MSDPKTELEHLLAIRARHRLVNFIPSITPKFEAPWHLAPLLEKIELSRSFPQRELVSTPPRHGKAIAVETPMFTPEGWTVAGAVEVGSRLFGSDGAPTLVQAVFPQGSVPRWRVSFSDGSSLVTCAEHRWQVEQRYGYASAVKTTAELQNDLNEADGRSKWRIPVCAPLQLEYAAPLILDPYLLGCWLGDGTSRRGEITTADPEIIGAFRAAGFSTSYEYRAGKATTYGIPGLLKLLRALNLQTGRGRDARGNKHIPEEYLWGSAPTRLAVLQGLADTDGTVAKNGSQQSFTSTNEQLAQDFKFLVNSLGGVWTEYARPAANKTAHTISFRLPRGLAAFRLHRKGSRLAPWGARNKPRRFITSIEPVEPGEAVCFTVAAPDGLFCAGRELVVTHNTETLIHAIAWLLKQDPSLTVGYATYAADLAKSKSRRARRIALQAGVQLAKGSKSVQEWRTNAGGGLLATGIGGGWTGHGLNVLFVDDPFKGRKEAESETQRQLVWDWYTDVAETRLEPGASAFVIMARWHEDDLVGRLERSEAPWHKTVLPAIDDDGKPLWPKRYPLDRLRAIEKQLGPYGWRSLYQGRPTSKLGAIFQREWFVNNTLDLFPKQPADVPDGFRPMPNPYEYTAVVVDGSWGEGVGANPAAIAVWSKYRNLLLHRHEHVERLEYPDLMAAVVRKFYEYRANAIVIEASSAGIAIIQTLRRETTLPIIPVAVHDSKTTRAEAVVPLIQTGRCKWLKGSPWLPAYIEECCAFPAGAHDDQVDTTSLALQHFIDKGAGFGFDVFSRTVGFLDRVIYDMR